MTSQPFHGVLVPVLTPFTPSGDPDSGRFVAFCRWLLDQGAGGLSVFGTTSEANSMSGRRAHGTARPADRGRHSRPEADARNRRLLDDRGREPRPPRRRPRLRRRADAAALLL